LPTSLKHGDLFDGRYRIESLLGSGGMADVYLATDEELGRQVAIKILSERYLTDESFLERFRREANAAAGLSHPNIVQIYDRRESAEGLPYISMEVIHGQDLRELETAKGRLAPAEAGAYMTEILAALGCAHKAGIVHRDVKPQNILIGDDGRIRVTDFGIARSATSELTEAGSLVGTASYMSPEQAQGQPVGPPSDLYSAGVVLYEMLTGQPPFIGDQPVQVALQHVKEPVPALRTLNPAVSAPLEAVVMKSLAKEPEARYQTAEDFAAALEAALQPVPEEATTILPAAVAEVREVYPPSPADYPPLYPSPPRRSVWPAILAGALLLAIAVIGGLLWFQHHQDTKAQGVAVTTTSTTQTAPTTTTATTPAAAGKTFVPSVKGLKQAQAVALVKKQKLVPQVVKAPAAGQPEGVVFKQSPTEAKQVKKGTTVVLTVAAGKPQVNVPDVSGQTFAAATQALTKAHLKAKRFDVYSDQPKDTVIAQNPKGSAKAPQDSSVRLNVSKGSKTTQVPDLTGLSQQAAAAALTKAGLKADFSQQVPSKQPAGTVVSQNPTAGQTVQRDTSVFANISKGPTPTTTTTHTTTTTPTTTQTTPTTKTVPDVTGETRDQAIQDLRAAGFNLLVSKQTTSDPTQDNIVLDESPAGNTEARPGRTITIYVGAYDGSQG
jgi:serine/threonine protein kinase/beta-lactam-binding protein with PASTA domain